ncbi:hypothetical protein, partial [Bacillus subtilis]|uniref:hypothetical protein n=1 Tax=Bacillus subtilis TaxID=1423 RepID=UPI001F30B080
AQAAMRISFGNPGSFTLSFNILFSSQKPFCFPVNKKIAPYCFRVNKIKNKKDSPFTIELG